NKTTTTIRDIATYQIDATQKLVGEPAVIGSGYDNKGRLVSYRDITVSEESEDKTTTVYLFDTVYNKFGMMNQYRQKSIETGISESGSEINFETNIYRSAMDYDKLGRISSYTQESVSESTGIKKEITNWRAEKYNFLGQLTAYYEDVQSFAEGEVTLNATTHNHRFDIEYTYTGLLKYYIQTSVSDASSALTTTEKWWADLPSDYNSLGQLIAFRTNTKEEGSYDGNYLLKITDVTRLETSYNSLGIIEHYKQETKSSEADNKAIEETWDADIYNTIGQVEKYTATTREYSKLDNGASLDKTTITTRTIASYILTAGGEIITDSTNSGYDIYGRLYSYRDEIESSDTDNKKTDSYTLSTVYDPAGRTYGYHQVNIEQDKLTGGTQLNLRNEIERTLTEYDLVGRVSHYIQTSVSDASSGKVDTLDWTAGEYSYNPLGQLIKYDETIHSIAKDENQTVILDTTTTNKRRDISYTGTGLLKHYIEETISDVTRDLKTVQTWDADYYNDLGQLIKFHTNTVESAISGAGLFEKTTDVIRLETHYNLVGLVDYYKQETISSDTEDKAIKETWDARESTSAGKYNSLGQVEKYTTTTREYSKLDSGATFDKTTITVRSVFSYSIGVDNNPVITGSGYDNKGRMVSYVETVSADDVEKKQVINLWVADSFNIAGQVEGYVQNTIERSTDPLIIFDKLTVTHREFFKFNFNSEDGSILNKVKSGYNGFGQVEDYRDTITEQGSSEKTATQYWHGGYNDLGQLKNYIQDLFENGDYTDTGSQRHILKHKTHTERQRINYYETGLIKDYLDIIVSSDASNKQVKVKWEALKYSLTGMLEESREIADYIGSAVLDGSDDLNRINYRII
ncbi:MAG: hypothetical protein COW10_01885, partial [Candidatus Omnitrophica bacterium CG12_big_fil_rev_8_21_14_0_65_42_8]